MPQLPTRAGLSPDKVRVFDQWAQGITNFDIVDIIVSGRSPPPSFVFKMQIAWTHAQLLQVLAQIVDKDPTQLFLTDSPGQFWNYPEARFRTSTVVLHVLRAVEEQDQEPTYPRVVDVIRDLVDQTNTHDLIHIQPMGAVYWRKLDRLVLPPQYQVDVEHAIDLRESSTRPCATYLHERGATCSTL